MRIGVFHVPNTLNLGSMMMAENFMWYAWSLSGGNLSFVVPTPKPEETGLRLSAALCGKVPINCILDMPQKGVWRRILKGAFSTREVRDLLPSELLDCDAFVVLGGDDFTESYSPLGALLELYKFFLFKTKLKKRVFLLGQTVGPFSQWRHFAAIRFLREFDLITCRDPLSYNYLRSSGLRNVALCADFAFLPLAKEEEDQQDKTMCVIVPSRLLYGYMPYVTYDEYVDFWCFLLERAGSEVGCKLVLLPHAMNWTLDDDRLMVRDIVIALAKRRKLSGDFEAVESLLLPWETRQLYFSRARLTITARMHAAISALSKGGLPINIAYSEKSHGVVGEHFSLKDLVIDVRRFSSHQELGNAVCSTISFLSANYETLLQRVGEKMPTVRELARQNIVLFLDRL